MSALKLNIGSRIRADGWKAFDIEEGPDVDYVGDCCDLSQFAEGAIDTIYASHVLEHVSYQDDMLAALKEWFRVLVPGGTVIISVPDFDLLCRLFLHPSNGIEQRFHIMRVIFGGQKSPTDFHSVGLTLEFLSWYLETAGFQDIRRVDDLGIFKDCSALELGGIPISLNVTARKPES